MRPPTPRRRGPCYIRLNTWGSQAVQEILTHGGPEEFLMSLSLLNLSADATVTGAVRNILKLILRLENVLSSLYSVMVGEHWSIS